MDRALLLNADHSPIRTLGWEHAVCLLVREQVVLVEAVEGRFVRSPSLEVPWPSVIALKRYVRVVGDPAPTRRNVLARDGWRCQYCHAGPVDLADRPPSARLTLDHVVPRSRALHGFVTLPWSGRRVPVSAWENLTTACGRCNARKGARLPEEAGLTLSRLPSRPRSADLLRTPQGPVPEAWRTWLPSRRTA